MSAMQQETHGASQMYQEIILDHFRNPRNWGKLEGATCHGHDVNTSCGDEITIWFDVKAGTIRNASFEARGCAISQAAASMLTDRLKGSSVDDALRLEKQHVLDELGVPISGMRLKCALLPLKVAKMALAEGTEVIGEEVIGEDNGDDR